MLDFSLPLDVAVGLVRKHCLHTPLPTPVASLIGRIQEIFFLCSLLPKRFDVRVDTISFEHEKTRVP